MKMTKAKQKKQDSFASPSYFVSYSILKMTTYITVLKVKTLR